jgi:hypothetical protein
MNTVEKKDRMNTMNTVEKKDRMKKISEAQRVANKENGTVVKKRGHSPVPVTNFFSPNDRPRVKRRIRGEDVDDDDEERMDSTLQLDDSGEDD